MAEPTTDQLRAALDAVLDAWESLPGGHYTPWEVEDWLTGRMWPAVKGARRLLGRKNPGTGELDAEDH